MKTVKVSKQSRALRSLLKSARRESLILRSPEGQEFILAEIDDFNREIELTRGNSSLIRFLASRAKQRAAFSIEEARRQLNIEG
jgi:hypothetical protein